MSHEKVLKYALSSLASVRALGLHATDGAAMFQNSQKMRYKELDSLETQSPPNTKQALHSPDEIELVMTSVLFSAETLPHQRSSSPHCPQYQSPVRYWTKETNQTART